MKKGDIRYVRGKKVAIVEPSGDGKGAIVQEIHVEDGKEFPAGPTFFAQNLADNVALPLTWEGKQIQSEKDVHKRQKGTLDKLTKDINIQIAANKEHLGNLRMVSKLDNLRPLARVIDFLAGDIRYLAIMGFGNYRIVPFVEACTRTETWSFKRYDGLKLMTLVGYRSSDRKKELNWNLNEYSDGSGAKKTVVPCKTKAEARQAIQKHIDAKLAAGDGVNIEQVMSVGCTVPLSYVEERIAKAHKDKAEFAKKKDDGRKTQLDLYDETVRELEAAAERITS